MTVLRIVETVIGTNVTVTERPIRVAETVTGIQGAAGPAGPPGPTGPQAQLPADITDPPNMTLLFENALI